MDDAMLFEFMMQQGLMNSDRDENRQRQALVDALRNKAATPVQGQMIGKHYVSPGLSALVNPIAQTYMANQGQADINQRSREMRDRQYRDLVDMRRRRQPGYGTAYEPAMDFGEY